MCEHSDPQDCPRAFDVVTGALTCVQHPPIPIPREPADQVTGAIVIPAEQFARLLDTDEPDEAPGLRAMVEDIRSRA